MRLRPTYRQADAARYRAPGGAWDIPTLDRVLSSPRAGDAPAIVDGDVELDAATLDRLVSALAGGLRDVGIRRGDVVCWQLPNWWEAIALFRACWRAGAVAAPIHHQVGAAEVRRMLDTLEPILTLSSEGMPLGDLVECAGVRGGDRAFDMLLHRRPLSQGIGRGSDVAVVLFTTGSTGHPKPVLHTNRGLAYKALSMTRAHALTTTDAALMPSPLAHVSGLLNSVLVPGTAAMPVVLMEKWDPERGVQLVADHNVSFMIGPPTLFMGMMDVAGSRSRLQSLRVVSCGGMGVTPEFIDIARQEFGATVKRTYGSTEAPTVTTCTADDGADRARDTDGHSVGEALIRVVVPGTNRKVPTGERGEVVLRGPELFVGYGDEGQTRAAVRQGWFATGDLGTIDADGWLTIVGRDKDVIIRSGENIASAEVERLLELHPGVRQAVVVGCPDPRVGERVAAFIVGDRALDVEECRRWFTAQGVARFKTPELVVHLEEIPLLGIGKPDRPALRARLSETR
ncbi:MAG TPA: AMP-binding protein [Acidimicrobiales bacterium]|nr:AMP-binding protein [Acidimicrobiales bacterium]